ncbi:hypothetical protein Golomagni_02636 [Golovinomyces magnicellulatus]|nr:hypothetical protein Golomagni_02636 [Golovinomyces magnicellulatus]
MSSTVNKIKDALHIGNNDEFEKGKNQSGIQHPGNSFDPDGLNSSKYSRAQAATGHNTLSGTGTGAGNENLSGTVLDYSTGQIFNPGDIHMTKLQSINIQAVNTLVKLTEISVKYTTPSQR